MVAEKSGLWKTFFQLISTTKHPINTLRTPRNQPINLLNLKIQSKPPNQTEKILHP